MILTKVDVFYPYYYYLIPKYASGMCTLETKGQKASKDGIRDGYGASNIL